MRHMRWHTHTHTQKWNLTADFEICSYQSCAVTGGNSSVVFKACGKGFQEFNLEPVGVWAWRCVLSWPATERERERELQTHRGRNRERETDRHTGGEEERDVVVGVWEIDEGIRGCLYVRRCTCSLRRPIAKHTHFLSLTHTHTHTHTHAVTSGTHLSAWIDKGPPSSSSSPLSPVCWIGPISNTDAALARFNLCCSTTNLRLRIPHCLRHLRAHTHTHIHTHTHGDLHREGDDLVLIIYN